jgi:zinc-binding alcohol dehydrogenase family protein
MKAIVFSKSMNPDDKESLELIEVSKPSASGRDILVKVEAVSINPVDYKVRQGGNLSNGDYRILGWDAAGVVEAVGEQVSFFKPGDQVFYAGDITRPGSNAEFQLVDERLAAKKPVSLNFAEAAALPLTAITAWELLFDRLRVTTEANKQLLVVGGAGGVGSILIQIAKVLTHLEVIATASREESINWVKSIGADRVINHHQSLADQLGANSVDYAVSLTNSSHHLSGLAEVIKPQGQLGVIDNAPDMNVMPLQNKSISFHWELMFTRSLFKTEDMIEQHKLLANVAKLVDQGKIKTTLTKHLGKITPNNLMAGHKIAKSGSAIGKMVLEGF